MKKNTAIKLAILFITAGLIWLCMNMDVKIQEAEATNPPRCYVFSTDGGVDVTRLNSCLQGWYNWATTTGMGQYAGLTAANTFSGANKFTGGIVVGPSAGVSTWTATPGCLDIIGSGGADAGYWQMCVGSDGFATLANTRGAQTRIVVQDTTDGAYTEFQVKGPILSRNKVRGGSAVLVPMDWPDGGYGDASATKGAISPYNYVYYPPAMFVQGSFTGDAGATVQVNATWSDNSVSSTTVSIDNMVSVYSLTGYDWATLAAGAADLSLKYVTAQISDATGPGSTDLIFFVIVGTMY